MRSAARPPRAAERLHKYLARSGVASRRAAERLIADGRVRVNGEVIRVLGTLVDPTRDRVEVDGRRIDAVPAPIYVMLHKPRGVLSASRDERGRRTVVDLVPLAERVFPVGRLDYDSEGLILLTNDGELAVRLTHPSRAVEKEYLVLARGELDRSKLDRLRGGVVLDDGVTAPATVDVVEGSGRRWWLRLVLREGRNRQIRRMAEAVGLQVERLMRVRIGPLELADLPIGAWRRLRRAEIDALREAGR